MIIKKLEIMKELYTGSIKNITNKNEISLKNNVNIINQAKKVSFQLGFVRVKKIKVKVKIIFLCVIKM